MWSRPVAEDWAEQRRRSRDGIAEAIGDREHPNLARGVAELWEEFTRQFVAELNASWRKRFALRWRTQDAVREVANDLAWTVAASLRKIVPVGDLGHTVQHAVLYGFQRRTRNDDWNMPYLPVDRQIARMLDWLIRHDHGQAAATVRRIVGDAERDLGISAELTGRSLRKAMGLDGKLDDATYSDFFSRVLPPES
jgi:hypothetical protein